MPPCARKPGHAPAYMRAKRIRQQALLTHRVGAQGNHGLKRQRGENQALRAPGHAAASTSNNRSSRHTSAMTETHGHSRPA